MKINQRPEYKSKSKPVTIEPHQTVSEAIRIMAANNYGSVVVVSNDNHIEGILTERDLLIRLLDQQKDPQQTTVQEIMSSDVKVANEDDEIGDWMRIMSNERFRHLPVVNENKELVHMMSQGDFVSYTWPDLLGAAASKAKKSISLGYQIPLIIFALSTYAWAVSLLT